MQINFYQFSSHSIAGTEIKMDSYRGKVVLVVNTATECGLTPQFTDLENLYQNYKDRGLIVLGFPCNQFGWQEPRNEKEITEFCEINYKISFQMFSKIDVNGRKAHPLFKYLKSCLPGFAGKRIYWNFTKFLIDRNGIPVKRFSPSILPESLKNDIESLL